MFPLLATLLLQDPAPTSIPLDALRPPAAPAFVLLGVAPAAVERPITPRALAATLISATGARDLLPRDYALEVAPYWLTSHPELTFDGYYAAGLGRSILQTLSISLATARLPAPDSIEAGTALGIGFRTAPLAGKAPPAFALLVPQLDSLLRQRLRVRHLLRRLSDSTARADQQAVADSLEEEAARVALAIQAADKERVGWIVEFAGAVVWDFPRNLIDSSSIARAGVWATVAYRVPAPAIDLVGVLRYVRDQRPATARNIVDFGGRLVIRGDDLALSGEFVEHIGTASGPLPAPGYRLAGNLEYRLQKDLALTATFGKDDGDTGAARLVAQIGLTLGAGRVPLLQPNP